MTVERHDAAASHETRLRQQVRTLVLELSPEPVASATRDAALVDDLGYHSLALVELAMALEGEFGLPHLSQAAVGAILTVGAVEDHVVRHLGAAHGDDAVAWDETFERILRSNLPALSQDTALAADMVLTDLGLDSLGTLEIIVAIEDEYGIELRDDDLEGDGFTTPGQLWEEVSVILHGTDNGKANREHP